MKTSNILFSLILCGTLLPLNAQFKGTVTDTDRNPIPFANVAIYSLPDSALISGKGKAKIYIKNRDFDVRSTYLQTENTDLRQLLN